MTTILTVAGSVVVAIIVAMGGYLVARRTTAGRIATSEAADLWQESQSMRNDLRNEIANLRTDLASARSEVVTLRNETGNLRDELRNCAALVVKLRRQLVAAGQTPEED